MLQAYLKLANNPETQAFLSDAVFMQKVQAIIQNPANYALFADDPKIKKAYEVISAGGMPNNFDFENFMKNMPKEEESLSKTDQPEKMDEEPPLPKKE